VVKQGNESAHYLLHLIMRSKSQCNIATCN